MKQSAPANFNPATAPPDRDADYVVYGQQENGYSRSSTRFFGDLVAYLVEALADHLGPLIDGLLIVARFRAGPHVTRHPLFDTLSPLYFLPSLRGCRLRTTHAVTGSRLTDLHRCATLQSKMKRSWKSSITAQFLLNEPSIAPSRGP
jgi:hypothetical protein